MLSLYALFFFSLMAVVLFLALRPRSAKMAVIAAGIVVLLGIALAIALTLNMLDPHPEVDVKQVTYELLEAAPVEFGTRLKARFHNHSPARLYSISGIAKNLDCTELCTTEFEVRIPVPANGSYTQTWTVRTSSETGDSWHLEIGRVQAY